MSTKIKNANGHGKAIAFAFIAMIFLVGGQSLDNYNVKKIFFPMFKDPYFATFINLVASTVILFAVGILYVLTANSLGKRILPQVYFNKKLKAWPIASGFLGTLELFFFLWVSLSTDPGTLLTIGSAATIFAAIIESTYTRNITWRIFLAVCMNAIGGIFVAFNGSLTLSLRTVILGLVLMNTCTAVKGIFQREGIRRSGVSSLSFSVAHLGWSAFWSIIMSTIYVVIQNKPAELIHGLVQTIPYVPWLLAVALLFIVGITCTIKAQATLPVAVVLLIISSQIGLGYGVTFLGDAIKPGIFGLLTTDPSIIYLHLFGVILNIGGAVLGIPRKVKRDFYQKNAHPI